MHGLTAIIVPLMTSEVLPIKTTDKHIMLKVAANKKECPGFATISFNHPIKFNPGQFIMLWIPGLDEKPYTLSHVSENRFSITIEKKGVFSSRAVSLQKGDLVGIRGPFGNGFYLPEKDEKIAVVAGGCGMAPIAPLIHEIINIKHYDLKNMTLIQGAKSREYLLYKNRFKFDREFCTDDGSMGHCGFVTDLLEKKITLGHGFDHVYACGPEVMMHRVFEICEKNRIHCQVSLERYMRCGFGLCGACVCADQVVCKDGPVFGSEKLKNMKDFNTKALLKTGREVTLEEYYNYKGKNNDI